jgi:plastocyanin
MHIKNVALPIVAALVLLPALTRAQHGDLTHEHAASQDAAVDFGVLQPSVGGVLQPIGPAPCAQALNLIGGAQDPCAYKNHHLIPEEVTILKGGEVTFQVHGGGHGLAIYTVSKDTTRDELGQFMCPGMDPETIADPTQHVMCNGTTLALNAAAAHNIADGKGDVVIVVSPNVTNQHPDNRVWYVPGRLMSVGGRQFLNGGTIAAGQTDAAGNVLVSDGQLITYQFLKTGRYLVICVNRSHSMNDWMFGFVNVVGGDGDDDHDGH